MDKECVYFNCESNLFHLLFPELSNQFGVTNHWHDW